MPKDDIVTLWNSPQETNWGDIAKNSIYTSVLAGAGAHFLFGESGSVPFLGVNLPAPVTAGVGAAAGSVASDLISKYVLEQLGQDPTAVSIESKAVKAGLAGLGTGLALQFGSGADLSISTVGLGAGSKLLADMVTQTYDPLSLFM